MLRVSSARWQDSGLSGYSGDGGPATAAAIGQCIGLVGDNAGNLYFSDEDYHVIRKVDNAGIISTIAGVGGIFAFGGDGGPATAAYLISPQWSCVG